MKFNKFVWELYVQSQRGKEALGRFSNLTEEFIEEWSRELPVELCEEGEDETTEEVAIKSVDFFKSGMAGRRFEDLDAAQTHFREVLVRNGIPWQIEGEEVTTPITLEDSEWYDYVAAVSLGFHLAQPELFLPYNFRTKFNQLDEIHTGFSIPLPPVPGKHDKAGRGHYYLAVNEAWQEFRLLHGLSPVEMCAFLYDFAPEFTTPLNANDLPSPSKVWLISGGTWDFEFADSSSDKSVTHWGGNAGVRRGDILMMYLVSPRSAIQAIWRASCDGFIDPFFHYHSTVWICGKVPTVPVTFAELKQHPLLSEKPAVRGHFQGGSSRAAFTVEEYEAILEIMRAKGQDISLLPRIPSASYVPSVELLNERDVEVHLIEPFLLRLGYEPKDWVRQMPVKMGRGERNYPDYAIGAKAKRGEESAKMILESKFQLSAQSEFTDAFYQAKSYALRLQSKTLAMAAREGVWVFPLQNGSFDIREFVHKGWGELNHPDHFHEVLRLIGRDEVFG